MEISLVNGHHRHASLRPGRRGKLILDNCSSKETLGVAVAALRPPSLGHTTIRKDGKVHRYWRLVRSVRVGRRVIQQTVAQLGELDEHGRVRLVEQAFRTHMRAIDSERA
jgi:hypothetical protein